jgi:hypothetical protein
VPFLHCAVAPLGAPVSETTGTEVLVGVVVFALLVALGLVLTGVPPLVQVVREVLRKSFSTGSTLKFQRARTRSQIKTQGSKLKIWA